MLRDAFKSITELSLMDYKWRSSLFKENEADRRVEESLARMRGGDPSYIRPMDATDEKIGPLVRFRIREYAHYNLILTLIHPDNKKGRAERMAVAWVSRVIEEEGKRAESILKYNGKVVRPIDAGDPDGDLGPLADLEKKAVDFINKIKDSEKVRVTTMTLRPKDLEESKRGPLGEAEAKAVAALREIKESERLRYEQSKLRGGEVVRPIDVPGPLGEIEMAISDVIRAEMRRAADREKNEGRLVRPKDSTLKGPLGEAEAGAVKAFERLTEEERERLRNVQQFLRERRPMENERDSPLGITEAVVVGMLRAPQLLISVVDRVKELMQSEALEKFDQDTLNAQYTLKSANTTNEEDRSSDNSA
jgi:hypothetical protein